MAVEVKICGICDRVAADAAIKARAEFAGLVFHATSPRNLQLEQATSLADRMRGQVRIVTLICDPRDDELARIVRAIRPDYLQLHGQEPAGRVADIRRRFSVPIIKAISVAKADDLQAANAYLSCAEYLMFDAKPPAGSTREGGLGSAFDWQILKGRGFSRPWFLAGGLKPDNVARAIAITGASAVDVSTGVETAPGVKSAELILDFVAQARSAGLVKEEQP